MRRSLWCRTRWTCAPCVGKGAKESWTGSTAGVLQVPAGVEAAPGRLFILSGSQRTAIRTTSGYLILHLQLRDNVVHMAHARRLHVARLDINASFPLSHAHLSPILSPTQDLHLQALWPCFV